MTHVRHHDSFLTNQMREVSRVAAGNTEKTTAIKDC